MADAQITSLTLLLTECNLQHCAKNLEHETLASLTRHERADLLAALKGAGIAKLSERQALCNFIGKAKKADRLLVGGPLDVPPGAGPPPEVSFASAPSTPICDRKPRVVLLHGGLTN